MAGGRLPTGVRQRVWASGTVTFEASWFDTAEEADAACQDYLRPRRRGRSGDPTGGRTTLASWWDRWMDTRQVAEDHYEGRLDLSRHLIDRPASTYLVRVSGWPMHDAGIWDGDELVVDRAVEASDGQVVVAVVDGEFTVKRMVRRDGCVAYTHNLGRMSSMGVDVGSVVARARLLGGLSRRQLAILAGVSPSTVSRIERGDLDPTVSVFDRLLEACGLRYGTGLSGYSNPSALRAARIALDPGSGLRQTAESAETTRRWTDMGLLDSDGTPSDVGALAERAGRMARLAYRDGAVRYSGRSWKEVARSLRGSGREWAITGGLAASRYVDVATATWPVFYVEDVAGVTSISGLGPAASGPAITLVPLDEVTAAGIVETSDGARWADPWQVLIDCYGGTGRMPDQAEAMLRSLAVPA